MTGTTPAISAGNSPGAAAGLEPGIERTIRKDGYLGGFEETVVARGDGP